MTNEINIAMITDVEYLLPTVVALRSLMDKVNNDVEYHIYLIMDEECQDEMNKYYEIAYPENVEIHYVLPNFSEDISSFSHSYVSKAALSKFCLAELLENCDKALYIDGDVLFHSDLVNLYSTDIENYYAAVVKDMPSYIWGDISKLGLSDYFNSGMMLLNLKKMRQDSIKDKLFDYKKNEIRHIFMDQDVFNMVFKDQIVFVSPIYNFISVCFDCASKEDVLKFYGISQDDLCNIEIDHIAGKQKPWKDASSEKTIEWFPYVNNNRELAICLSNYQKTVIAQQQDIIKQLVQQREQHLEMISACEKRLSDAESKISSLNNIFFIRLWRKIRGHMN